MREMSSGRRNLLPCGPLSRLGKASRRAERSMLLQHSDLRVMDFFSVRSQGVDGLAEAVTEQRGEAAEMEQEAERSDGSCHLPSSSAPPLPRLPEAARCDLQEESHSTAAPPPSQPWLH